MALCIKLRSREPVRVFASERPVGVIEVEALRGGQFRLVAKLDESIRIVRDGARDQTGSERR